MFFGNQLTYKNRNKTYNNLQTSSPLSEKVISQVTRLGGKLPTNVSNRKDLPIELAYFSEIQWNTRVTCKYNKERLIMSD
jgi:broad specificity phosphatase PhoE